MFESDGNILREAVREALLHGELRVLVEAIYADVERELAALQPRCEMSGRCCRFEEYGHRLFVTTAELAVFAASAADCPAALALLENEDAGGCRFQEGRMCQAHPIRPLGCRMFFCDPAHEEKLQALYERLHARLKALHDDLGITYCYVEWRSGVAAVTPLIKARLDPALGAPNHDV